VPKGILLASDDNSRKYGVTFELPADNYLELREYPIEATVLTIVPEEKSEIPDEKYPDPRRWQASLPGAQAGENLEVGFPIGARYSSYVRRRSIHHAICSSRIAPAKHSKEHGSAGSLARQNRARNFRTLAGCCLP
jgi:hypothetical protein